MSLLFVLGLYSAVSIGFWKTLAALVNLEFAFEV